ncbi:MAG TPA: MobA/MobL family protein [Steroidobacteraceae bacterium]|nr:MobA/MobL family protein [Steroidobacteraceae bacterium]
MATYFLRVTHISRGKGARSTRAAAYRAGERIRDERTGEVYDYSGRRDVVDKAVVLPSDLQNRADMAWTQDRSELWNAMEYAGVHRNARLAREWLVCLPPELNPAGRSQLVRAFAQELADQYRCAVDMAVHLPRPGADPRNHHAHLMSTTREVTPEGIGIRTTLEWGGRERHERGLGPSKDEYLGLRERWAQLTNEALKEAGLSARVDHRSLEAQGINREPVATVPGKVLYTERRTGPTVAGDAIRARYQERVEARLRGREELARVVARQKSDAKTRLNEGSQERGPRRREHEERKSHSHEPNRQQHQNRQQHHDREGREHPQRVAEHRPQNVAAATADEAARRWVEYRKTHEAGPTADESAQSWRAYREHEKHKELQKSPAPVSREQSETSHSHGSDSKTSDLSHDLEI